jgi:DNA-binding response OmpR family regulator
MIQSCVLLVEDDVLVRASLSEYLRACGFHVLEAVDGDEARQLFDLDARPIDVVLVDLNAGGEGGFGLASWVRTKRPGVEVILTGSTRSVVEKAGDLCRSGSAPASYDHSLVLDRIRRLVAARNHSPE